MAADLPKRGEAPRPSYRYKQNEQRFEQPGTQRQDLLRTGACVTQVMGACATEVMGAHAFVVRGFSGSRSIWVPHRS